MPLQPPSPPTGDDQKKYIKDVAKEPGLTDKEKLDLLVEWVEDEE
jgi:hypothetical protein